jgi:putative membrane protein
MRVSIRRSNIDPARAARALVLVAWAGFFAWLWVTGEVARYLGPRTYWVVPFGIVVLVGAAAVQASSLRRAALRPFTARAALGLGALLVPILAVAVVPAPALGSLAASKKATGAIALGSLAAPAPEPGREISFIDIYYASRSQEYANAAGISDITKVALTGFVTTPDTAPQGTFEITRFYVSCCAADAVPYSATVVATGPEPPKDSWVDVAGTLSRRDGAYVVVADRVTRRPEPEDPYLY